LDGAAGPSARKAVTEALGITLAGFRKRDDALRKRRTNWVVTVGGGAKRGQRHLKGNSHLTDGFAVEIMTVEIRSDGHGKAAKAPSIVIKFHSTKIGS
jgi:hypothetical protein